ncbi:MAG: hypothetical protein ACK5N8_08595 [Alphaproteobacteria bacterium]
MLFLCLFFAKISLAREDYYDSFKIDLDEKLPTLAELQEKYAKIDDDYDWKYDYHWNIGNAFDRVFKKTIMIYGASDVRVKKEFEDELESMIKSLPPEYYQYIGPYLHEAPGISEKILNMPGIKETKNKFPTRIAKEVEGIENLEFLSPYLYFSIMPEAWASHYDTLENPIPVKVNIEKPEKYDEDFFARVKKLVPEENYVPGGTKKLALESRLRSLDITSTSPLTYADAQAFTETFDDVAAFGKRDENFMKVISAGFLLDKWEKENGKGLPLDYLRSIVNPCQRLVQKIKLAGLENQFLSVVSKKGFTVNGWAYTCDKSIKAYRVANVHPGFISTIKDYKNGRFDDVFDENGAKASEMMHSLLQGMTAMYQAPMSDVMEVRNERENLYKAIVRNRKVLIDSPIIVNN